MTKIVAFLKSLRWIYTFGRDLIAEIFRIKNKDASTTLILARTQALNNQLKRLAGTGGNAFYTFHEFREIQELCMKHNHIPTNVLEIGTGSNLGILTLFLLSTAKKVYGVDIEPMNNRYDNYFYESLRDYVKITGGTYWYQYSVENRPIPHLSFPTSLDHVDLKHCVDQINYLAPCSSDAIPLEDSSLDMIYSMATMEHLPKTRETIKEIKRLLIHGGITIHEIDMSYHRYHTNPLEMLKHSEEEWQSITNQYGNGLGVEDIWDRKFKTEIYCNRLRTSDFVQLFEENGFGILEVTPTVRFDKNYIDKSKLDKSFLTKSLDDLSVTVVIIVAKCRK